MTEREEIELHPAVGELIVKMRAKLAEVRERAKTAEADVARLEFALQCEATRHEATRAAVREYFAAIDATGPITPEYGARWAASREVLRKIVEGDR